LSEPKDAQISLILKAKLTQNPKAIQYAYNLSALKGVKASKDLNVPTGIPVYKHTFAEGKIIQYIVGDKDTAGQGLILVPSIDLKTVPTQSEHGYAKQIPIRLSSQNGSPLLLQMGPRAMQMALASRAREY